jgi:hypothetical protein
MANAPLEIERFWEWVAEPDACEFCQDMDGTIHPIDEPMDTHPNCRCTMNILEKTYTAEDLANNTMPLEVQLQNAEKLAEAAAEIKRKAESIAQARTRNDFRKLVRSNILTDLSQLQRLPDEVDAAGNRLLVYKLEGGGLFKVDVRWDTNAPFNLASDVEKEIWNRLLSGNLLEGSVVPLLGSGEKAIITQTADTLLQAKKAQEAAKRLAIAGARFGQDFIDDIVESAIDAGATNFTAAHFNVVKSLGDVPAKYWLQKSIEKNWDITEMRKQVKIYKQNIKK